MGFPLLRSRPAIGFGACVGLFQDLERLESRWIAWISRWPRRCCPLGRACPQSACRKSAVRSVSDPETLAEIDAAHIGVGDDLSGGAIHQNLAIMQDIGAVDDLERLAHIMVGDQHADAAVLQMADKGAELADRDRVDPGKGLVE